MIEWSASDNKESKWNFACAFSMRKICWPHVFGLLFSIFVQTDREIWSVFLHFLSLFFFKYPSSANASNTISFEYHYRNRLFFLRACVRLFAGRSSENNGKNGQRTVKWGEKPQICFLFRLLAIMVYCFFFLIQRTGLQSNSHAACVYVR